MQSLLIFIAEFQTAKRRLLNNFEVSRMKLEKLIRTECYRTRSVATKTESVSPNTPRTRRRSFLSRLGRLRDYSSANVKKAEILHQIR
jgi:hypothetical protein